MHEWHPQKSSCTESFTYVSPAGTVFYAFAWLPDAKTLAENDGPVAAVQISHGIGEHALRYAEFAEFLSAHGFAVYVNDHLGHGATGLRQHHGNHARLGRLGAGGLRAAEAGIVQLQKIIRERHPGLPVGQFGHSWGSLMTQRILQQQPRLWDAVVLSGTAYRTLKYMESGDLNAKWAHTPQATGLEWLSRNRQVAADFIADPLCFPAAVRKLLGLRDALRLLGRPAPGLAAEVPILLISGGADPLSRPGGLQKLAARLREVGVREVSVKLYPEARHELLHEINAQEVFSDVSTWFIEHLGA